MYPEDRVLVAVIKTRRDVDALQTSGWYRIPEKRMPEPPECEYIAFFYSGSAVARGEASGICTYGRVSGIELAYRHQLLGTTDHPRAYDRYYRVAIDRLERRVPPITNPTNRAVAFIHTTWDRFCQARIIPDLYSEHNQFVERAK